MANESSPESTFTVTLQQLISAIQLMQAAVNTLNVVIESNTDMSNALTSALGVLLSKEESPASNLVDVPRPTSTATATPTAGPATATTAPADTTSTTTATTATTTATTTSATATTTAAATQAVSLDLEPTIYGVIVGREPGLFDVSDGINENVARIPGQKVVRFTTGRKDAVNGFKALLEDGKVERVTYTIQRTTLQPGDLTIPGLD